MGQRLMIACRRMMMKNKRKSFDNRVSVRMIVIAYIAIHLLFVASNYIPDSKRYTVSALRSTQNLSQYSSVTLIRWDYAPSEGTMEIAVDIKNTLYQDGKITMEVVSSNKRLKSQIVYSNQEMLVVQAYKVPKKKNERITLTFHYEEDGKEKEVNFYTYVGIANIVSTLPILTEKEYYYNRQDYDIAYYNSLISEADKKIGNNKKRIKEMKDDLKRLTEENESLTTDELLNLDKTITNEEQLISALESENSDLEEDIDGYNETIKILEERKDAYE